MLLLNACVQACNPNTVKLESPTTINVKQTCAFSCRHVLMLSLCPCVSQAYDRITVKQETPLQKTGRAFRNVSTSEDPIIR